MISHYRVILAITISVVVVTTNIAVVVVVNITNLKTYNTPFKTARDCSWCSKCSKCISATEDCSRTCILSFLEGAQHGSNDSEVESSTPTTCRTFVNCSDCLKEDKCAWRIPRCSAKGSTRSIDSSFNRSIDYRQ